MVPVKVRSRKGSTNIRKQVGKASVKKKSRKRFINIREHLGKAPRTTMDRSVSKREGREGHRSRQLQWRGQRTRGGT